MANRPVVVGVDGSEESLRAVEWAALEAARRRAPLRIVSVSPSPPRARASQLPQVSVSNAVRGMAARALGAGIARSEEVAPGLLIDTELVAAEAPAIAITDCGSGASMLVVGARGAGGFAAMLLGSVSRYAASHGPCPVVVVREQTMAVTRRSSSAFVTRVTPRTPSPSRSRRPAAGARSWSWCTSCTRCQRRRPRRSSRTTSMTWQRSSMRGSASTRTYPPARTSSWGTRPRCSRATAPVPT